MGQKHTVAAAIREAREYSRVSLREVADKAGVSAAQINRIENGHVERPSVETLVAIARGLGLNPFFLLVLSGHVSEGESRRRLLQMFDYGSEVQQEFELSAAEIREHLGDPSWPLDEIHRLAFDLFIGEPLWEVAWTDSYLLMASEQADEEMREIATLLASIIDERRPRVIEYLRDQVELSRRDQIRINEADIAEYQRMLTAGEMAGVEPLASDEGVGDVA